uniref:Copper transport protein family n=1 Tax=Zea mays TaxID=4577 RepID=A0A804MEW0_MAIZE
MKQKIVIKVCMPCDKCRSKAMGLAAIEGVSKIGITGDGRDQLEVEGDDIDTVCLVNCLRKKVGRADIVKVKELKPEPRGEAARGEGETVLLWPHQ